MKRLDPSQEKVEPVLLLNLLVTGDTLRKQKASDCQVCNSKNLNEMCFGNTARSRSLTINGAFQQLSPGKQIPDNKKCAAANVQLEFPTSTGIKGLKWLLEHSSVAQDATLADVVKRVLSATSNSPLLDPPPLSDLPKKSLEDLRFRCF